MEIIRYNVPNNVRIGLAPLAWNPDTWKSVEEVWIPEQRKIIGLHDFVCVHSYWQQAKHYNLPPFGGNVTEWRNKLMYGVDLPYIITEWGNSSHERGLMEREVERIRLEQYPEWIEWVSTKPYVEAAYLFILGSTPDWTGFIPTDKVLRAIGTTADKEALVS